MKLSDKTHEQIDCLIREGLLSDSQIASKAGCSATTVWHKRQAFEAETSKQLRKDMGFEPMVYRGGGEW